MKYARKLTWDPQIADALERFAKQFKAWWLRAMPGWRGTTWPPSRDRPAGNAGWEALAVGGGNGIFLFILALVWWREAATTDKQLAEFQDVIRDVRWTLESVCRAIGGVKLNMFARSLKRGLPDENAPSASGSGNKRGR